VRDQGSLLDVHPTLTKDSHYEKRCSNIVSNLQMKGEELKKQEEEGKSLSEDPARSRRRTTSLIEQRACRSGNHEDEVPTRSFRASEQRRDAPRYERTNVNTKIEAVVCRSMKHNKKA
jgi:hypothetical protein